MKHHIRTLACGAALLAAIVMIACGGKQTMASKSAAAYDEARKKGLPVSTGEHGGHEAHPGAERATTSAHEATPGMDHSAMAGMDHSQMTATNHAAMPGIHHDGGNRQHDMAGMNHSAIAGMNHSQMPGMEHGGKSAAAHTMGGMDHSSMAGMDHSQMSGMQHGTSGAPPHDMSPMQHGSMPNMQHGTMVNMPHGSAAPLVIAPPSSNAVIAQTQPGSTLRGDEFDAPARSAVDEAAKAADSMNHSTDMTKPPPHKHDDGGSVDQR
jgi:uncharacterized protein involved in copper resistance